MLNEKLKELRENIGLSQADVADLMFCSRSLIAKWEQGRANPSDNDLKSLSDIYKCSYEELLKETKNIDVSSFSFSIKNGVLFIILLNTITNTILFKFHCT